jgi:hypothetical protein
VDPYETTVMVIMIMNIKITQRIMIKLVEAFTRLESIIIMIIYIKATVIITITIRMK